MADPEDHKVAEIDDPEASTSYAASPLKYIMVGAAVLLVAVILIFLFWYLLIRASTTANGSDGNNVFNANSIHLQQS